MRPMTRARVSGEPLLDHGLHNLPVRPPLHLRHDDLHDESHLTSGRCARLGDGLIDE